MENLVNDPLLKERLSQALVLSGNESLSENPTNSILSLDSSILEDKGGNITLNAFQILSQAKRIINIYSLCKQAVIGSNHKLALHLMTSYPSLARERDRAGNSLLHFLFRESSEVDERFFRKFVSFFDLKMKNYDGKYPEDCQGVNDRVEESFGQNIIKLRELQMMSPQHFRYL